ncbi:hypothetical protein ACIPSE_09065 [Streptomyces sp. NPDC090106]|uniref:hypothetical protein n=1 Tax=Streptomyces sp. NPDC090106 TaxID=3365946 RepID=UPI0037F8F26B
MSDGGYVWQSEAEKSLYKRLVRACLDDENLTRLRRSDPSPSSDAVCRTGV